MASSEDRPNTERDSNIPKDRANMWIPLSLLLAAIVLFGYILLVSLAV